MPTPDLTPDDLDALDYLTDAELRELDALLSTPADTVPPEKDYRQPPDWFHDGQKAVFASTAQDVVACAGNQGGKGWTQPEWLLRELQRCAPIIRRDGWGTVIFAGPTLTLLSAQTIPTLRRVFEDREKLGRQILGNKPSFRFSREGVRKLLGFDIDDILKVDFAYANDSSNLESTTAIIGVWDEAGQKENKQESLEAFNRRLGVARSTTFADVLQYAPDWWIERFYNVEGPDATFGRRLWGTTPYEWNWFKNLVYDLALARRDGFDLVNWPSWMNPRQSREKCEAVRATMPEWRWQMMYLGLFTKPAGVIYDTFDYAEDTIDDFEVPDSWPKWPGVDFGAINLAGVVLTEVPESVKDFRVGDVHIPPKTLLLIREYHAGRQKTYPDHIAAIRGPYKLQTGAGGNKHGEDDSREAFRANGMPLEEPPVNDVEVGIGCVYAQVKSKGLKVFRSCTGIIADFQGYSREVDVNGDPTEKIADKSSWHRLDALRYLVAKLRPNRARGCPVRIRMI